MFENSSDDFFLPSHEEEELVDSLLRSKDSHDRGLTLAKALLPLTEESPSPSFMPWVCSTRYKTELCTSYSATGFCKYAQRCQFAHGLHELRIPFRHPKYKTELCRSYHTTGYCYYGSRCLFVHDSMEQRQSVRRRRNVPCRTFRAFGVCPFGTRCNFLHVQDGEVGSTSDVADCEKTRSPPRTQGPPQSKEWKPRGALCHTFSSFGFCLYGTCCRFQHGLPSKIKGQAGNPLSQLSSTSSHLPSSTSSYFSTSSSPSISPLDTPSEAAVHNAFTFSSQHLNDLLLPLALRLQQLESNDAQEIWASSTP
ncbi:cysteine three histidine 1 [Menidia menidia]